jgi:hypothetical protein
MRSQCAGAALDPPFWIVPNKTLSLSLMTGHTGQNGHDQAQNLKKHFPSSVPSDTDDDDDTDYDADTAYESDDST